jgi:hypothetical protein
MAVFAVSITKRTQWRGKDEEFSNVYHYWFLDLSNSTAIALINKLKDAEKPMHSTDVTFVEGVAWGPVGDPSQSDKIALVEFPSTEKGIASTATDMDREACWVVKMGTNRQDIRSRKIYLRKWLHTCSAQGAPAGWLKGTTPASATQQSLVQTYFDAIKDPIFGSITGNLCSPRGDVHNNTVELSPYVEHHEFRY